MFFKKWDTGYMDRFLLEFKLISGSFWAGTAIKAKVELIILTMAHPWNFNYHLIIQSGTNPIGKIAKKKSNLHSRCHLSDLCSINAVSHQKSEIFFHEMKCFFNVMSQETWSFFIFSDAETLNLGQTLEAAAPYIKFQQTHRSMTCLFLHSQSEKSDPSLATRDLSWRPVEHISFVLSQLQPSCHDNMFHMIPLRLS